MNQGKTRKNKILMHKSKFNIFCIFLQVKIFFKRNTLPSDESLMIQHDCHTANDLTWRQPFLHVNKGKKEIYEYLW